MTETYEQRIRRRVREWRWQGPTNHDPLVVCTHCFAPIFARWCERWKLEHPVEEAGNRPRYVVGGVPSEYGGTHRENPCLAVVKDATGISIRRLWGILHYEWRTVAFDHADRILCAIGDPDLMPTAFYRPPQNFKRPDGPACSYLVPQREDAA